MKFFQILCALCLASLLTACGGGSGNALGALVNAAQPNTPPNVKPVANAGLMQNITLGYINGLTSKPVVVNGAGSTDANGDKITYRWSLKKTPAGSSATLATTTDTSTTFTADKPGEYWVGLVVNDGKLDSDEAVVIVNASIDNSAPIANPGPDQTVVFGPSARVTLDGTYSTDADNDQIFYEWVLERPAGSAAVLTGATSPRPTFIADVKGVYKAYLTVYDGKLYSKCNPLVTLSRCSVTITADSANAKPIAIPTVTGSSNVTVNTEVALDGTSSRDDNNDTLTYKWNWMYSAGTTAPTLNTDTAARPKFTPTVAGVYVLTLVVNDNKNQTTSVSDPTPISITVSAVNSKPEANAGTDRTVTTNATVTLTGTATDANLTDTLTYKWYLKSQPVGSTPAFTQSTVTPNTATFTPTTVGMYVAVLIVNDGKVDSEPSIVVITRGS
jgi:hypothetical protein